MYVWAYIYIYIYIYMCVCVCVCVCFQIDVFVREPVWSKVYLMGYSLKLDLTRVCSLNGFYFWVFFNERWSFLFLWVCFSYSTLFLINFWYLIRCMCVYVSVGVVSDFTYSYFYSVCVCVCVCVCVNMCLEIFCAHIYIYKYADLFPFVCVYDSYFIQFLFKFLNKILFLYLK